MRIRGYLADVWHIDTARVSIDPTADEMRRAAAINPSDRRRVVVVSEEPAGATIVGGRVDHEHDPPLIALDPHMEADAGVRAWRIDLSYRGRTVGSYTSDRPEGTSSDWSVEDDATGRLSDPLVAELTVEDSLGNRTAARSEIPIVVERHARRVEHEIIGANETLLYTLYVGPVDSGAVGERNGGVIEEIAGRVRAGATVVVSPASKEGISGGGPVAMLRDALRRHGVGRVDLRVGEGSGENGEGTVVVVRQAPIGRSGNRR